MTVRTPGSERWQVCRDEDALTRQLRLLVRESLGGTPPEVWGRLGELGVVDFDVPMTAGGLELGPATVAVVCEEVGASPQPIPLVDALVVARLLVESEQPERLTRLRAGSAVAVAGRLPAPHGVRGDRPAGLGRRFDTTLGPFSTGVSPEEVLLLVTGEHGPEAHLRPVPDDGIAIRPLPDRGGGPVGAAVLDAAHLDPSTALVGGAGELFDEVGRHAAVYQAALIAGLTAAALTALVERLRTRHQFGRALVEHQVPRLRTAALLARLDVVRLTVAEAATGLEDGSTTAGRAAGTLALAAETGMDVSRDAVHLHGASGLGRSTVVAGCYRRLAWEAVRCGSLPALWRAAAGWEDGERPEGTP